MDKALVLCAPHGGPVGRGSLRYDVCLSFAGVSAASPVGSFLGRLRAGLAAEGVSVCALGSSRAVCPSPQFAEAVIRWSKICIPILSDYASSEQCLRWLVQMMEGKKRVLPIFNRVEPSDLRYQKGSFRKDILPFDGAEIERVKRALLGVSYLYGWRMTEWREEELVEGVVQTVLRCLRLDLHNVSQSARYNVFLNFRGADTRHGITYKLYKGLTDAGVSVFKDDTNLVIEMLKCTYNMGHMVIPIFYKVSLPDVKHQMGSFGEAIRRLREMRYDWHVDTMEGKQALHHVSNISRWELPGHVQFLEERIKGLVVRGVLHQLGQRFQLDVPKRLLEH